MKLRLSDEVRDYLRALAPEPRRKLSAALDAVEAGKQDLEPLEGRLAAYYKLRERRHRVVCAVRGNTVLALYADERATVYEVASVALLETIAQRMKPES